MPDASIVIAGFGLAGSLAAVAVTWSGQRKTTSLESDRVKVDAWVAHNEEQEARIADLKSDVAGLRVEVEQCHREKDEQRDEFGAQILALRRRVTELEGRSP